MMEDMNKSFFCPEGVENSCDGDSNPLSATFQTLFLERAKIQQNLADDLNLDKAYISRICNGKEVPPLRIRLAIARWFNTDSSLIWRSSNLNYIRKILAKQKKEVKDE